MNYALAILVSLFVSGGPATFAPKDHGPLIIEQMGNAKKPKDLRSALTQLDLSLGQEIKEEMKALPSREEMVRFQYSIGTWIRNEWLLWSRGKLQRYFKQRGVTDPEVMTSVILEHYYDMLHGDPLSWRKWEELHPVKGKEKGSKR